MLKKKIRKTIIIAEAGVNHNGNIKIAKKLVDVAAESGADIVKFQSFSADRLATKLAGKAKYQKKKNNPKETQYEMLKKLELNFTNHKKLIFYCKKKKIEFLSSPFDIESIKMLKLLKIKRFKIPSGEITNLPYLYEVGKNKKPIILSTGMATLEEVRKAISVIVKAGTPKNFITVLQCNTAYPSPPHDVNLNAMLTIKNKLNVQVGLSDHTLGIEVPLAAVALGAKVIEKHFTLNKKLQGPDHRASLEPKELKNMVDGIRNIELAMGNGIKKPTQSEIENIPVVRKSIVASKKIKRNEIFSRKNLTTKRPGNGLSPMLFDQLIGKKSERNFKEDEKIRVKKILIKKVNK